MLEQVGCIRERFYRHTCLVSRQMKMYTLFVDVLQNKTFKINTAIAYNLFTDLLCSHKLIDLENEIKSAGI